MTRRVSILIVLSAVLVGFVLGTLPGCDESRGRFIQNVPPEVLLTAAPPDSGTTGYAVEFYWEGRDSDGEVDHFIYAVDPPDIYGDEDSVWTRTEAYSGTFAFEASGFDTLLHWSDPQIAKSWHVFVIKAVDDMGAKSEPEYVVFNAATVAPRTRFTTPEPGGGIEDYMGSPQEVGLRVNFRWEGDDPDVLFNDGPVGYLFKVVDATGKRKYELASTVWEDTTEWIECPPEERKKVVDFDDGRNYAVAVRAIDEAGAVEPLLLVNANLLWVGARERFSYPELNLSSTALGSRTWQGWGVDPEVYEVPLGSRYEVEVSANADWYGGIITGFSYGWDLSDLETTDTDPEGKGAWSPWSTFKTTITAEFTEGRDYFLHVKCKDDGNGMTLGTIRFRVIRLKPSKNLCYIDDFRKYNKDPALAEPLDDQIWQTMLAGYNYGEDWEDVSWDEWEVTFIEHVPSLEFLSRHSVVVWSLVDSRTLSTYRQTAWFYMNSVSTTNVLAIYMRSIGENGERPKVWAFGPNMVESAMWSELGTLCYYPYAVGIDRDADPPCGISDRSFISTFLHITGEFDESDPGSGGARISAYGPSSLFSTRRGNVYVDTAGPAIPKHLYTRPPAAELYPSLPKVLEFHPDRNGRDTPRYLEMLEYPRPSQEEQHIFYDPVEGRMTDLIPLYRARPRSTVNPGYKKYCAFRYIPTGPNDPCEIVYFFFPMYCFKDEQIRALAKVVLTDWFGLPDPDTEAPGAWP